MFFRIFSAVKLPLSKGRVLSFCDKMKVLGLHLDKYIDYALLRGIPYEKILNGIEYPSVVEGDGVRMVDPADFYTVLERIGSILDDELLGIRVGAHLNLNTMGAVYRISQKTV